MVMYTITPIFICIIGAFGLFGNVNILIAIYRTKPRVKSSLLVALVAFCDTFCIMSEWQNVVRSFLGLPSYRRECFWAISYYLIIMKLQTFLMCALAFDRIFAFAMPFTYIKINNFKYVVICCIPGLISGVSIFTWAAYNLDDAEIPSCNPPIAYPAYISQVWIMWTLVVDCMTLTFSILALLLMVLKIRRLKSAIFYTTEYNMFKQQRQISKSCAVILVIFLCTAVLCHLGTNLVQKLSSDKATIAAVETAAVLPIMLAYAQPYFVYFWSSRFYRKKFQEQAHFLLTKVCCCARVFAKQAGQVSAISNIPVNYST